MHRVHCLHQPSITCRAPAHLLFTFSLVNTVTILMNSKFTKSCIENSYRTTKQGQLWYNTNFCYSPSSSLAGSTPISLIPPSSHSPPFYHRS
ncbi:hypothetical protein L1887_35897 [Cichorium endivia]|nr:hypothetical protein L1887_35897 [Cichorium endivia]